MIYIMRSKTNELNQGKELQFWHFSVNFWIQTVNVDGGERDIFRNLYKIFSYAVRCYSDSDSVTTCTEVTYFMPTRLHVNMNRKTFQSVIEVHNLIGKKKITLIFNVILDGNMKHLLLSDLSTMSFYVQSRLQLKVVPSITIACTFTTLLYNM